MQQTIRHGREWPPHFTDGSPATPGWHQAETGIGWLDTHWLLSARLSMRGQVEDRGREMGRPSGERYRAVAYTSEVPQEYTSEVRCFPTLGEAQAWVEQVAVQLAPASPAGQ